MLTATLPTRADSIVHPERDGQLMADHGRQLRWLFVLVGNLAALFCEMADVLVSGTQFWYPLKGELEVCAAPDVFVVFGRSKGERISYKQWEEANCRGRNG